MQALAAYALAVGKIGRGTGKSANRHRKTARDAANSVKAASTDDKMSDLAECIE